MKTYTVTVTREGRWWMVHVPELDGLTQARRLEEVPEMAREWIALNEDLPVSEVEVEVAGVDAAGMDVASTGEVVADLRRTIEQMEAMVSQLTAAAAVRLQSEDVSMRDIASIIGVSHQRVAQIVNGADPALDWRLMTSASVLHACSKAVNDVHADLSADLLAKLVPIKTAHYGAWLGTHRLRPSGAMEGLGAGLGLADTLQDPDAERAANR